MVNYRGQITIPQTGYGVFKGKKRQRGGRKRKAGISEKMSQKILSEFSKAAKYGKKLAKNSVTKVRSKFRKMQKVGLVMPRRYRGYGGYRSMPDRYLMY